MGATKQVQNWSTFSRRRWHSPGILLLTVTIVSCNTRVIITTQKENVKPVELDIGAGAAEKRAEPRHTSRLGRYEIVQLLFEKEEQL